MRIVKYRIKSLIAIFLSLIIFIIYRNVKYFPDRPSRRIADTVHISRNEQVKSKETEKVKPVNWRRLRERINKLYSKMNKRHNFICIDYIGGLGNIMFLYASAYGLARMKNMDLVIQINNDLFKIFNLGPNNLRIVSNYYKLCYGAPYYSELQNCAFDENLLNINNKTSFWISGYLQSYKYFEAVSNDLRSQFTFRTRIQEEADSVLSNIMKAHLLSIGQKQANVTLIGIHIRRGDMVGNTYGYTVGTKEYFQKAMDWFRSKYPNSAFVVCSNDISWGQKNLKGKDVYFVENKPIEIDFAVLVTCDHLISSVGSFSWWAAWLCKGTVIYLFPPARNGSGWRRQYCKDYSDYFLRKWIHF